ncbi:hypothetical protein GCM10027072_51060 [Streptomyces bullii]
MKGDDVESVGDAGDRRRGYEGAASGAGHRVETTVRRGVVEVSEVTRWGFPHAFYAVGEDLSCGRPASWRIGCRRCWNSRFRVRTARRKQDRRGAPSGKTLKPRTPSPPRGVLRRSWLILREARQAVRGHDDRRAPDA